MIDKGRTSDIQKDYIQSPIAENIWTVLGPDIWPDAGKSVVVVRALYGLKSTGANFWNHLDDYMKHMEYMIYTADP